VFFSTSVKKKKNAFGILIGIALNLQMAFGSIEILTIFVLAIHEHRYLSSLFVSLISFIIVFSFQHRDLSPPWLNLFLSILVFLMVL